MTVQSSKGHGRREVRTLHASTDLNEYLDWPHVGQVAMLEREWWARDGSHHYQVRKGGPAVMAALRNTAIGLLRRERVTNIAEATRRNQMHPQRALKLLGLSYL